MKTYQEVAGLSAKELNKLCSTHKIKLSFSKTAKVILVCLTLGISTCGNHQYNFEPRLNNHGLSWQQLEEFRSLTPGVLVKSDGWTKDLQKLPPIDDSIVKKYLVNTNVLSREQEVRYKIQRPYQMREFVHSLRINLSIGDTFIAIEGQCNSSQSTSPDNVKALYVLLDKISGQPYGAYCTCTVGLFQSCAHVGAVLFELAELVSRGYTLLPDDPSCTEKLCSWTDPKSASIEAKVYTDIKFGKIPKSKVRRTVEDFGRTVTIGNCVDRESKVSALRHNLFAATQALGKHVAATAVMTPANMGRSTSVVAANELPIVLSEADWRVIPAKVVEASEEPPAIADMYVSPNCKTLDFVSQCTMSERERRKVELVTRGQSSNIMWYKQRAGSITTTNFHKVKNIVTGRSKASIPKLVSSCMGDKYKHLKEPPKTNKASLKWGVAHEALARKAYFEREKSKHRNLVVKETGLIVHKVKAYLRGSPDGIVLCACCPPRLLEIKCPYSAARETIRGNPKIKYLDPSTGFPQLLQSHAYMDQIQGCMAVTGLQLCHLFVYTVTDAELIPIHFDRSYWSSVLEPSLDKFFTFHLAPAILQRYGVHCEVRVLDLVSSSESDMECEIEVEKCVLGTPAVEPLKEEDRNSPKLRHATVLQNDMMVYCIGPCKQLLPEPDEVKPDNSDASVGCECPCGCQLWSCWKCANYTEDMSEEKVPWFCANCVRNCENVYRDV